MDENKVKILLVDDRPENLFSLESLVEGDDRIIFKAESGNQGLQLALKHEFGLILSDVQMPEMNGFEMVEILRMNPKNKLVPIIFVTAISKEDKYVHQGYEEGAVDYLFKPLDADITTAKVDIFVRLAQQKMELEKQKVELEGLNELKNRFIGMAAHDLRNPIGVISFYSKLMMEDTESKVDDKKMDQLSTIYSSSMFMSDMVNELLDFTKIESGTFTITREKVNLNTLIGQSISLNRIYGDRKNISINKEIKNDLPLCLLDYGKVNQVLNNLISNAIKYSNTGTEVLISAEKKQDELIISVKDQGQGIPSNELAGLFEAFSTTSIKGTENEKSTGLGLNIVAKIVEAHGGDVKVSSQLGIGSVFSVHLPFVPLKEEKENLMNQDILTEDDIEQGAKGVRILVCEDDMVLTMLVRRVLKMIGLTADFAEDGQEGLDLIKENEYDLIFTDINMPGMDGYMFGQALKDQGSRIPVYALTSHLSEDVTEKCKEVGMKGHIEKPLSKLKIQEVLKEVLLIQV